MFIDGHTLKVRVPYPPPSIFDFRQSPELTRTLVLRTFSKRGAVYIEGDRRKAAMPVVVERRKGRPGVAGQRPGG